MLFTLQIQKVGPDVIKSFSLICILTLGLQKNCIFLIEFNKDFKINFKIVRY